MKKTISVIATLIALFSLTVPQLASAKHEKKGNTKGVIVEIQGKLAEGNEGSVTIKDKKGNLHKFKFDKTTVLKGRLGAKTGVKIDVQSEEGGHAVSVIDKKAFEDVFLPDFLFLPGHASGKAK